MNRGKKLLKNTIIISIGKICTQFISFLLLPLYTSFLSTNEYGIVDLVNTIVTLLLPIVSFQIYQGVFRELIDSREDNNTKSKVISTGFFLTTKNCLIFLIFASFISFFIQNNYKFLLVINLIVCIYLTLFQQISRGFGDNTSYTVGSFISALFTIIFNIIFIVLFKFGAYGMLLGTIIGQSIGIVYFIARLKLLSFIKINDNDKNIKKKLLDYSLPLIPNTISWWLICASDSIIVSSILGVEMNGILAASLKFSTIVTTLYGIFDLSWIESISANINDEDIDVYFNNTINVIIKLFLSLCVGIIACLPFVFPILINHNFSSGYGLVPISIISSFFNVVQGLVVVVFAANKNTKFISKTSVLASIINVIIDLLLIRFLGLYAAVLSTLVAYFIVMVTRFIGVNKNYFKIRIDSKIYKSGCIILTFVIICYYVNNLYFNILSLIISVIYAIMLNRNTVKFLLDFVKKKFVLKS